jgi:hypothetical protein
VALVACAVHGSSRMSGADSLSRYAALPRYGEIYAKMDHLVCFVPAMLALGVHAHAVADQKAAKYLDLAEELGRTCWQMYAQMPSGAHGPAAAVTCDSNVAWVACVRCMAPAGCMCVLSSLVKACWQSPCGHLPPTRLQPDDVQHHQAWRPTLLSSPSMACSLGPARCTMCSDPRL